MALCAPSIESAGIHDILSKCLGTTNKHNVVNATIAALQMLRSAEVVAGAREMATDHVAGDYPVAAMASHAGGARRSSHWRPQPINAAGNPQGPQEVGRGQASSSARPTGDHCVRDAPTAVIERSRLRGPGSSVTTWRTRSFRRDDQDPPAW